MQPWIRRSVLRSVGTLVALLVSLVWTYSPASALESPTQCYADTLRTFNPRLDRHSATLLAEATILDGYSEGVDTRLIVALIATESSWNPWAVSPAGARGLGQLMPATAARLGVDPDDPLQNIHGVAVHLRGLLLRYASESPGTQYVDAIAAYNAGAGAVDRYGGIPPYTETRNYVRKVIGLWYELSTRRSHGSTHCV